MKINICGVEIDQLCFNEVVEKIVEHVLVGKEPKYVVTPNAQHIVLLQNNARFREYYRQAF
ncbi:hypothetical protein [Fischerella sp. NIES-3754]|nr:hypothetical protein [Fischerella sp. NIES-3754]BAU06852.1 hypothetical protein FIS3754_27740 [Fischerella sp. NIES-3754]